MYIWRLTLDKPWWDAARGIGDTCEVNLLTVDRSPSALAAAFKEWDDEDCPSTPRTYVEAKLVGVVANPPKYEG